MVTNIVSSSVAAAALLLATSASAALTPASSAAPAAAPINDSLLSRISDHANLTMFAGLIRRTGPEGAPSPDLEMRFNNAADGTPYTIFAPSNDAMSKISAQTLAQLQRPYNYEILLSLIRSHIVKGSVDTNMLLRSPHITSVEGIELPVQSESRPIRIAGQAAITKGNIKASNGIIHIVDTMIDPFMEYFQFSQGVNDVAPGTPTKPTEKEPIDAQLGQQLEGKPAEYPKEHPEITGDIDGSANPQVPVNAAGPPAVDGSSQPQTEQRRWAANTAQRTMSDIMRYYPQLSNATSLLEVTDPIFLNTVLNSYMDAEGHGMAHYFVPSNTAFNALPYGSFDALCAPSNRALSAYLVTFGYTTQELQPSTARFRRPLGMVQSERGLEMVMVNGSGGTRVQNALVEGEPLCTRNGCVWIVDRFLDPVFGKFGSSLLTMTKAA